MRVTVSPPKGRERLTAEGRDHGPERDAVTFGARVSSYRYGAQTRGEVGVTVDQHDEQVIQAWNEHRPYLIDLAFRMLGDIGAAEDVVQDAFARLLRARPGEIEDERGWLIVVTSRLCLDQIRSARSRRERPHDAGEIEFVPGAAAGTGTGPRGQAPVGLQAPADPADRITLDDDVQLALLV